MTRPSLRLRLLTAAMRYVVKPKLRRTATPEHAKRSFERYAPILFSKPKGMQVEAVGGLTRISVGDVAADRAILYLHGGAFVAGSASSYGAMAARLSKRARVPVFVVEYPLVQDAPFPAAPDAVLAAWNGMLATGYDPSRIVIAGDSAGGNLAFVLLSDVLGVGQKPAGLLAFSPWTDLSLSGETLATHAERDPLLPVGRIQEAVDLYLAGARPDDPRASPLFARFSDPPPVLIQVGADEILLSDSRRMAEIVGARISVWDHVPHVWQIFDGRLPEANRAMRDAAKFVQTSFESASR